MVATVTVPAVCEKLPAIVVVPAVNFVAPVLDTVTLP